MCCIPGSEYFFRYLDIHTIAGSRSFCNGYAVRFVVSNHYLNSYRNISGNGSDILYGKIHKDTFSIFVINCLSLCSFGCITGFFILLATGE